MNWLTISEDSYLKEIEFHAYCLSEPNSTNKLNIRPARLKTLGDFVRRFHGDYFFGLSARLTQLTNLSSQSAYANQLVGDNISDILDLLSELRGKCQEAELHLTIMLVKRIEEFIRTQSFLTYQHIGSMLGELRGRILDEMTTKVMWELDPNKVDFYTNIHPFGDSVADRFPELNLEIQDASRCYAVGQNTACVFHLMRVLEGSLNWLATQLGVSFERRNWENVIADIERAIKDIDRKTPKFQFYSEAATHFRHVKDAWRNHVMHLRDRHDETSALEIYSNVHAFMRHLATDVEICN